MINIAYKISPLTGWPSMRPDNRHPFVCRLMSSKIDAATSGRKKSGWNEVEQAKIGREIYTHEHERNA